MADMIPAEQKRVAAFRKEHGSFKIGDVTVDMVIIFEDSIINVSFLTNQLIISGLRWYERY